MLSGSDTNNEVITPRLDRLLHSGGGGHIAAVSTARLWLTQSPPGAGSELQCPGPHGAQQQLKCLTYWTPRTNNHPE